MYFTYLFYIDLFTCLFIYFLAYFCNFIVHNCDSYLLILVQAHIGDLYAQLVSSV